MHAVAPLLLAQLRPDLTHWTNYNAPVCGGGRFVVTFHDLSMWRFPAFFGWKKRWLSRTVMPHTARRARVIVTLSEAMKREIVDTFGIGADRVCVAYPAPDAHFAPVADPAPVLARHRLTRPYLLFVGTWEPRKNLPRLLEAFALLDDPTLDLAIVGARGWQDGPLRAALAASPRREAIHVLEYLAAEDLPALYSGAAALVSPSLYEGFGLPPVEAMACGTPAVVSDIAAHREVCGDAAFYCDPASSDDIARAVRAVLALTADTRAGVTARGQAHAARYSWERHAEALRAAYARALDD